MPDLRPRAFKYHLHSNESAQFAKKKIRSLQSPHPSCVIVLSQIQRHFLLSVFLVAPSFTALAWTMQVAAGDEPPPPQAGRSALWVNSPPDKRTRKGIESLRELPVMLAALHSGRGAPRAARSRCQAWRTKSGSSPTTWRMQSTPHGARGGGRTAANLKNRVKKFVRKTSRLFTRADLRQIVTSIDDAQDLAMQLDELHQRYGLDLHGANAAAGASPSILASCRCKKMSESLWASVVGTKELIDMLFAPDGSEHRLKTVSIVDLVGWEENPLPRQCTTRSSGLPFDCGHFFDWSKSWREQSFKRCTLGLDKKKYDNIHNTARDQKHLIDEVRYFLENKRYALFLLFSSYRFTDLPTDAYFSPNWY